MVKARLAQWMSRWRERRQAREQARQTSDPRITFPIGGRAALAVGASSSLRIADS